MLKSDYLHARIAPDFKRKLEQICEQEHRSQAAQIECWIKQYKLNEEETK